VDYTISSWESFLGDVNVVANKKTVFDELQPCVLSDLFKTLDVLDIRVDRVYMNAVTYSVVRKWGLDIIDISNDATEIKKGILALIWGAELVVQRTVPSRTIIAISEDNGKDRPKGAILTLGEGSRQGKTLVSILDRVRKSEVKFLAEYRDLAETIQSAIRDLDNITEGDK
jgi:hypothetical protein